MKNTLFIAQGYINTGSAPVKDKPLDQNSCSSQLSGRKAKKNDWPRQIQNHSSVLIFRPVIKPPEWKGRLALQTWGGEREFGVFLEIRKYSIQNNNDNAPYRPHWPHVGRSAARPCLPSSLLLSLPPSSLPSSLLPSILSPPFQEGASWNLMLTSLETELVWNPPSLSGWAGRFLTLQVLGILICGVRKGGWCL